jgi:DeoR/GlpR family transcriptional regulator of sugar metabolism
LSRSARLLALLEALRCRRRPVTAAALARELQVSERTIYRDLSELRGDDVLTKAATNAHAKILAVLPQEVQVAATLPMTIPGPKANGFPEGGLRAAR